VRISGLLYFLFISLGLQAQGDEWLNYFGFRAYQLNNIVQVEFGIVGGASCNGARLQRLNENGVFENINQITGVCGGSEFPEYYAFPDENPLKYQLNTYRIEFGFQQGFSRRLEIIFTPLSKGVSISPNPASDECRIQFENTLSNKVEFSIYDSTGKLILELNEIYENSILLNVSSWQAGMYSFNLKIADQPVRKAKILVARSSE